MIRTNVNEHKILNISYLYGFFCSDMPSHPITYYTNVLDGAIDTISSNKSVTFQIRVKCPMTVVCPCVPIPNIGRHTII